MTELKFDVNGLIPAVVQDVETGEVLMVAYMNEESLKRSLETGKTHFWSRSRQKLWMKGETSGHWQEIREITADCDGDTLLVKVKQHGPACHTGARSCFYRNLVKDGEHLELKETACGENKVAANGAEILDELYRVIVDRRQNPKEGSYTNYLFDKGIDKILKKLGEEAAETIIAAKNRAPGEVIYETADLLYHLFVLLVEQGISLDDIYNELRRRR